MPVSAEDAAGTNLTERQAVASTPWHRLHPWAQSTLLAVFFAFLMFVASQLKLTTPNNPVPFTMQTFVVVLAGLLLRPAPATAAMAIYLVAGALGLPVFANFTGGLEVIAGPTGGYMIGFFYAPIVVRLIARRSDESLRPLLYVALAALVGNLVIFAPGILWLNMVLSSEADRSLSQAIAVGLVPFIPWTLVKSALAAFAVRR
jgi:biotin transport system substrate-specific component